MAVSLTVTLDANGSKALAERLKEIDFKAKNPRPFLLMYGNDVMKGSIRDSMRGERDPVTLKPWPKRNGLSLQSRRGGGGKMLQDTTHLLRSFVQAAPKLSKDSVTIGSDLKYARTHQQGMVIRPKKKFLTIPLDPSVRKLGSIKRWWDQAEGKGQQPFFFRAKSGTVYAAYYKGASAGKGAGVDKGRGARKGKLTFAWILLKQVTIPQRRYLGFGKKEKGAFIGMAIKYFRPGRTV